MNTTVTLSTLTLLLALPVVSFADPSDEATKARAASAPRARTRGSFFARASLGAAGVATAIETKGSDTLHADGNGVALSLQVGGGIADNLALHSDFMIIGTTEALSFESEAGTFDADSIAMGGLGIGLTYYLPWDFSVGGSLLYALTNLDSTDGDSLDADYGAMAKLEIAKEFQVSDRWALGLGLSLFGAYGHGENDAEVEFDAMYGGASINVVATHF